LNLSEVPAGRRVRIERIGDQEARAYLLRLGVVEGSVVECVQRTSRGPVVLRKSGLEVSVGYGIARTIVVSYEGDGG
jgi:Fe2+ transport system protein FeoA